ncbi:MAG: Methyl-accepting chemotaxis sensory transducer [Magnetococcales bacterium]|nr:Methyl-accepting chemotaxis sensory transducer [Magnetococcales bacterium]
MSLPNRPKTLDSAIEIIEILYENLVNDTASMQDAEGLIQTTKKASENLLQAVENILTTVGQVKKIAGQTKLLAINAGIEAAQAGKSGRGFLVVAEEVKELSKQTSAATTAISREIQEIQLAANETAASLKMITKRLDEVKDSNYKIFDILERMH